MKNIFAKLLGGSSRLSELEKMLLDSIKDRLDKSISALWDKQVQAINKIQRLPGGVEVDFYRMKGGHPSFNNEISFPNKTKELLIANVKFELPNTNDTLLARVWCINGFIFSIEYEGNSKYIEEYFGMDEDHKRLIIKCDLIADLSMPTGE